MQSLPLTVKRAIELLGLYIAGMIIIAGQQIIMPLVFSFFVSIVLLPVYRFLVKIKLPRVLAIFLSLLLMIIVVGLIIFFISTQIKPVIDNFPEIKQNITKHINNLSAWFSKQTNVSTREQTAFINNQSDKSLDLMGKVLGGAAGSIGTALIFFGLLPIYTFLILFYKDILVRFVYMWFPAAEDKNVRETISETESIIQSYIGGLLIQITYITILLGGTLLIFGIPYALLIGVIFAILNLVPYIGALFGNIIGVLLTLSSSPNLSDVLTVLIIIAIVQFLDNNILMPRIVGGKVKINALASLAGVIIGGALAGISGMFLSLPMIAVAKVVFERTERFKQWAVLFADKLPQKRSLLKRKVRK